ncbi:hypothetical protein H2200_006896 [Cladophialophora chaetospira]|uniref:Xylanolytic transcriptional activator regulatory domain-containing protein n=1 Tax=Cladophialophora chaetospira TaxID=386627 RepID=A0AA38X993_9EURO|nr:hypothetical protein H2200_006896 [Cladophialophora chaetospira]
MPPASNSDEVMQKLNRIESMLERQGHMLEHRLDVGPHSYSTHPDSLSQQQPSSLNSSPWTEADASHLDVPDAPPVGTVLMYGNGYERFVPGIATSDADAINELIQSASTPALSTNFPFTDESRASRKALLELLPLFHQCDELKNIFFEVFSPLFHILHDPAFDAEYASFRRTPGEVPLSFLALVFVVLSVSVNALDSDHPFLTDIGLEASPAANIKSLAAKYRSAAMKCLSADEFLWRHNLHTVQALVLLIYAISHSSGPSWSLLGTTFHICVSIGCHIDPSQLGLDPVRSEQRRRCWAGLMLLYTIQNAMLGNLAPMKLTDAATVRNPADLDDEDILLNGTLHRHSNASEPRPPTKMSYILLKFKLYSLASDICQFARTRGSVSGLLELEHRITEEEQEHEARFADGQQLPNYHVAHQLILNNYVHYLRLMLHRPYLQTNRSMSSRGMMLSRDQALQSRAHCTTSAMAILRNHEDLWREHRFKPYRWFVYSLGSFQAFLAASTLIVLLDSGSDDADRTEFIRVLHRCQARFEDMSARSDLCVKAAAILRKLLRTPPTRRDNLEPPLLVHQASSASDESEMCSNRDGHSSVGHAAPMMGYAQPGFGYEGETTKMDTSWFNCPPQMYDLMSLPTEQWLGGPSAMAWDWNGWLDVETPLGPETLVGGPGVMMR